MEKCIDASQTLSLFFYTPYCNMLIAHESLKLPIQSIECVKESAQRVLKLNKEDKLP